MIPSHAVHNPLLQQEHQPLLLVQSQMDDLVAHKSCKALVVYPCIRNIMPCSSGTIIAVSSATCL